MTTQSCGEQLKRNLIVNSYIEEGKPPVQPSMDVEETCRFEKEWSCDFASVLQASAVVRVSHTLYDGYFLSLTNTCLPLGPNWCNGGGLYPTDLLADNHKFREIWTTLHPSVRPKTEGANAVPAIGAFLHRGETYTTWWSMVWKSGSLSEQAASGAVGWTEMRFDSASSVFYVGIVDWKSRMHSLQFG